jgi:hypothetical protein
MNCSKTWNIDFLVDNFTYAFINGSYKKHREDIIFDRQLSMMEETQKVIERRKEVHAVDKEIAEYHDELERIKERIRKLKQKKSNLLYGHDQEASAPKFYGHCPVGDCRGFLTGSSKCGICDTKVCLSCKEIWSEGHVCNQDTLETLAKIRKDSRPCPKCKCMIHRIEGCRQMWCTNCQTAFDWNTGELVTTSHFHNPHYVEWQRRNGGSDNVPQQLCGNNYEYISPYQLERTLRCDQDKKTFIIEFLRCLYHVYDIELQEYRRNRTINDQEKYLRLRIDYIEKRLTKEGFKNKLQQQEKKDAKRLEVCMVFDMFYNTGRTIINQILLRDRKLRILIPTDEVEVAVGQINDLVVYTNESMDKISTKYRNMVPNIRYSNGRFTIINH